MHKNTRFNMTMYTQQSISFGEVLAQQGMQDAIFHADSIAPFNWSDKAYEFLTNWLHNVPVGFTFKTEDVRNNAEQSGMQLPPSNRAWGSIICKARKEGLIKSIGFGKVSNPLAHACYANTWVKI